MNSNIKSFFFIIIIFILLLNSFSVHAQKESKLDEFLILYKNGNCKSLIQKLKPLSKKELWINRDIWLRSKILNAKCQINLGSYDQALNILNKIQEKEFNDALIFQKIRAFFKLKNYHEAFKNINDLLQHPKKSFYFDSLKRVIKEEFVTDKDTIVIFQFLNREKNKYKFFMQDFEINSLYLRGASNKDMKVPSKYRILAWQFPIDEESARKSQETLNTNDLEKITSANILKRVGTLRKLKLYKYLIEHLPELKLSKKNELVQKLGNAYLRSLFKEKFYARIITLYKNGVLSKKWSLSKETQLYWTALAYIKRKDIPNARSTIYKLEKHNKKSKKLPFLFDKIASRYLIDLEIEKAKFWWRKLIKYFPHHYLAKKSLWLLSWTNIQEKNLEKALYYLNKGLEKKIYNSEMKAKFIYWQGKLFQKSGNYKLAKKSFKELILNQPNTYYGIRLISSENAKSRIFDTDISVKTIPFYEPETTLSKENKFLLRRSEFLFDIFESKQAIKEIFVGLGKYKNFNLNWQMAIFLNKKKEHSAALKIIANSYLPKMINLRIENSTLWKLAFPRPYWKLIKGLSNKAGIDPYFALAIMREESRFDPKALSSSKAMGLMQLMPATAKDVAKKIEIKLNEKSQIFEPNINIRLGIFYLGKLAKKFQSELIYTAGGYNAGPHNMTKWINRWNGISLDEFSEKIPYNETKNYVKRVYRSYKIYKKIYKKL